MRFTYVAALLLGLAGCKDAEETIITTQVLVDLLPCIGDGAGDQGEATCRGRISSRVGGGEINVCFVVEEAASGATTHYLGLKWDGETLTQVSGGEIDVPAGRDLHAELYFLAEGAGASICSEDGISFGAECNSGIFCVAKLVQQTVTVAEGEGDENRSTTKFDFPRADGACNALWNTEMALEGATDEELCDGLDNDCDGKVDEAFAGLTGECTVGIGACANVGATVCTADGTATECDATAGDPPVAMEEGNGCNLDDQANDLCDNLDNDCDGEVDEGLDGCVPPENVTPCGEAVGVCGVGTRVGVIPEGDTKGCLGPCLDAAGEPVVVPNQFDEVCDELDNDCDGDTDEGMRFGGPAGPPVGEACQVGEGECIRDGMVFCDEQNPTEAGQCSAPVVAPAPSDTCDGLDDDCDGEVDEEYTGEVDDGVPNLGEACAAGDGACRNEGVYVCDDGRLAVVCDAVPGDPGGAEVCDGVDNNCNGQIDETFRGRPDDPNLGEACTVGVGACRPPEPGEYICNEANPAEVVCSAEELAEQQERCNLLDDDCDGDTDEGFNLQTDEDHCGQCDNACELPNATSQCVAGECAVLNCQQPFEDADRNPANGCECDESAGDEPGLEFDMLLDEYVYADSNCDGVDGNANRAVFVSAALGRDDGVTGEQNAPYRTLQRALQAAEVGGVAHVIVDSGVYDVLDGVDDNAARSAIIRDGLQVPAGVSIHGGYAYDPMDNHRWGRGVLTRLPNDTFQNRSLFTGSPSVLRYEGHESAVVLDNVMVEATDAENDNSPSVALMVLDCDAHVSLINVIAAAGDGARGRAPTDGPDGQINARPGDAGNASNAAGAPSHGGDAVQNELCPAGTAGGGGGESCD